MKNSDINEEVEVMLVGNKFHLATANPKYEFYQRRMIPKRLWDLHNKLEPEAIDVSRRIMRYFKPVLDSKIFISKYHQDENN